MYKGIDRDALRENMRYFLAAIMPVCEEYGVNMCVHPETRLSRYWACRVS